MKKPKIGIIGVGRMGQYHLNILTNQPNIQLIGISDKDVNRLDDLGYKYEVPGFDDYKKLIKKCDALIIATPTSTHFEFAKACLEDDKHILLEKPMTTNIEEAKELVNLAKRKKLIIQVGHIERFNGAVQQLKKIVTNPLYFDSKRMGPYDPRISDVGVVLDLLIHDIDILLNLVEEEVVEISASGSSVFTNFEDIASAQLVFEGGCIANIHANRVSQKKIRSLDIIQKDSYVSLDYGTQDIEIHRMAKNVHLLTPEEIRYTQESFIEHVTIERDNPLKLELVHFINCLTGQERPVVHNEKDLKTLDLCFKVETLISNQIKKYK